MGGSTHTLLVLEGKKKSKSKCLEDKEVESHEGQHDLPMGVVKRIAIVEKLGQKLHLGS